MRCLLISILIFSLWTISCSDSTTAPGTTPPPAILAEAEIGVTGGSLSTEDFELIVPTGAFTTATRIQLIEFKDEFPVPGDLETGRYTLSGLPSNFTVPLTLRLRAAAKAETTNDPVILLGENVFVKTLQAISPSWSPLEAQLVDGFIEATLPALSGGADKEIELIDLPLGGTFYYSSLTSNAGHFKVFYPLSMLAHAQALGGYLEEAHADFLSMGFSYASRTRWPIRAIALAMPSARSGESVPSMWGDNYGALRFSTAQLSDHPTVRVTAGHEFFHLVQAFYDSRGSYTKAISAPRHLWLDEATAVWCEERFSDQSDYVSTSRSGVVMSPFEGLEAGVGGNAGFHGYGMSAMIKYLVGNHGETILPAIYAHILGGESTPKAVESAIGTSYADWYNGFLVDYFRGRLYGDYETPFMIAGNVGSFSVAGPEDTLKVFTTHDPAVSASLFKIPLYDTAMPDGMMAEFSLGGDGPAILNIFKYKSSTGAFLLGQDSRLVEIPDVDDIRADGYMLVAMLSSLHDDQPNYIATKDHTTAVHLYPAVPILKALQRTATLSYGCGLIGGQHTFRFTSPDTTYLMVNENNFPNMGGTRIPGDIFDGPYPPLSFSGRSFTSSMSYSGWSWDLAGSFSADGRTLEYVEAHGEASFTEDLAVFSFRLDNLDIAYEVIDEDSAGLIWHSIGTSALSDLYYLRTIAFYRAGEHVADTTIEYVSSTWYAPSVRFSFSQQKP